MLDSSQRVILDSSKRVILGSQNGISRFSCKGRGLWQQKQGQNVRGTRTGHVHGTTRKRPRDGCNPNMEPSRQSSYICLLFFSLPKLPPGGVLEGVGVDGDGTDYHSSFRGGFSTFFFCFSSLSVGF